MDGYLHDLFPGKSLEEIDQMDQPRIMRMMRAKSILNAEQTMDQMKRGKINHKSIPKSMWADFTENNKVYEAIDG